jgi:hypothetical protein
MRIYMKAHEGRKIYGLFAHFYMNVLIISNPAPQERQQKFNELFALIERERQTQEQERPSEKAQDKR